MKIAGIIAEYNPFHNGHAWQIAETRRMGATHIVAVMSGCYTQRGEPALCDKWLRTRGALLGGCDLVLELPLPYAMATAQRFAQGGLQLLDAMGVSWVSFGSECGELPPLRRAAEALGNPAVQARIPVLLSAGITYAAARQRAVEEQAGASVGMLLQSPNNILAIEYLTALDKLQSTIEPVTVKRLGAAHDSDQEGALPSASALRRVLRQGDFLTQGMPELWGELLLQAAAQGRLTDPGILDRLALAKLRGMAAADWATVPDIAEGLENRFYDAARVADSLSDLLARVKTKRYTLARLRRIALAGWLGLTEELGALPPPYLRILGMNRRGSELLGALSPTLPLSHAAARLEELGELPGRFIRLEAAADDLYGLLTPTVQPCGKDYTESIIKLP
ncbi:MAG: nucleotidyltransferase family protein [Angelakisella sp.]